MTDLTTRLLESLGLPARDELAAPRTHTFPDGGQYRVELPSVEGVAAFSAVLDEAERLAVPVHRVSQGSGVMMLTDSELRDLADMGSESAVEVCLFVGPRAIWDGSAASLTPDGGQVGYRHSGMDQLRYALRDVDRACASGIRSLLVGDEGLMWLIDQARSRGDLPADLVLKGSASLGISNPLQARMLVEAGMDTANVTSDTSLARLASYRRILNIPIDLYVESPDALGGFLRYHEIDEIVRLAAPVYLKFGLRNSQGIYPAGQHLEGPVVSSARERVRRARIGLEHLERLSPDAVMSPQDVDRHGVPVRVKALR